MSRNHALGIALLAAAIAAWAAVEATRPRRQSEPGLAILPFFKGDQDTPLFLLDYTNQTGVTESLTALLMASTITLDGKEHRSGGVCLIGNDLVKAGVRRPFLIGLDGYLPRDQSNRLRLDPGRHTLSVRFGGREYGPIRFVWDLHNRRTFGPLPAD
jgi:hypothetical protein